MSNISIPSPNMKYLPNNNNNNNHFFIKRKLKASICTNTSGQKRMIWCIIISCGAQDFVRNKVSELSFQFPFSICQCSRDQLTNLKKQYKQKRMKLKEERRRSQKRLQKVEAERTRRRRRRRKGRSWYLAETRNKPEKI